MTDEEAVADVHPDFDPLEQDIGVIRPSDAVATGMLEDAANELAS